MGTSFFKPQQKEDSPSDQGTGLSLQDKEERAELNSMMIYSDFIHSLSSNESAAQRVLEPEDNSQFADQAFIPRSLPLDEFGFVQSFCADEEKEISAFFQKCGMVVVHDVLTNTQAEVSATELWDAVERNCPSVRRDDPSSWDKWCSLKELGFLGGKIILSKQFCDNRQNPNVHKVFANLLGTPELHVNVSRASVMRPTRNVDMKQGREPEDKPEWRTQAPSKWLHWDMNPFTGASTSYSWRVKSLAANRGYDRLSIQGILALSDCGPSDGGFCCVPNSHTFIRSWAHTQLSQDPLAAKKVLSPYGPMQLTIPEHDPLINHIQKAPIRAGSLLIWDSKTAHCNFPNASARPRLVQYLSMKRADDDAFAPEFTDRSLLPPPEEWRLTSLGERLHAFAPWPLPP